MAILVRSSRGRGVLLDYGVSFDENDRPVFPQHVRPRDLCAVVLSHAHLDHSGALPSLYVSTYVPLYSTSLTMELSDIMFKDMVKLSGYYLPYTDEQVRAVMESALSVVYGERLEVCDDIYATFLNAGHIPGSMMTLLEVEGRTLLFTGDFNYADTNLLRGADLYGVPHDVDVVIMEGTYVAGTHPPRERLEHEFVGKLREVLEGGGMVLIPSFTLGRTQEILVTIVKHGVTEYPILVDGLARQANQIVGKYPQYLRDYRLYRKAMEVALDVPNTYVRKNAVKDGEPTIIIAPAGMLKGGAAVYYLKKLAGNRRNAIFLPSFQAPGTPGYELLVKGEAVVDGSRVKVEARVEWFDWSAHSGRRELTEFIKRFSPDTRILLVHTEPVSALNYAARLRADHGIDNVYVTLGGEEISL